MAGGEFHGRKKRPGRFTIQFNLCDPKQKAVSDLLDQQGRSKAQFLTSAVLHYLNCPETPECRAPLSTDRETLEKLVLEILAQNTAGQPRLEQCERKMSAEPLETDVVPQTDIDVEKWFGGKNGVASILSSLEMFPFELDEYYSNIPVNDTLQVPVRFQRCFRAGYGNWESTLKRRR